MIVSKQIGLHIKKDRRLIVHFIVGFHIDFIVSKWLQVLNWLLWLSFLAQILHLIFHFLKVIDPLFSCRWNFHALLVKLALCELIHGFLHGQIILVLFCLLDDFDLLDDLSDFDKWIVCKYILNIFKRPSLQYQPQGVILHFVSDDLNCIPFIFSLVLAQDFCLGLCGPSIPRYELLHRLQLIIHRKPLHYKELNRRAQPHDRRLKNEKLVKEYSCRFFEQLARFAIQHLTDKITALLQEDIAEVHCLEDNLVQLSPILLQLSSILRRRIHQNGIDLSFPQLQANVSPYLLLEEISLDIGLV